MTNELINRLRDRRVLGRAVSLAENGGAGAERLLAGIDDAPDESIVVGITGSPGSGKSTLIDALIQAFRNRGMTVAVVAIDPSSPFSGGALLGDRCRMNRHQKDPGVYMRSLSARGSVGGTSEGARRVTEVLQASGFDVVLVETVGAGQSEVSISGWADLCVLVCTPNTGDDVQAIKSGILEVADVLVVNKADLAGARHAVEQLTLAQNLPSNLARQVPIISTVATAQTGIDKLVEHVMAGADRGHRQRKDAYVEQRLAQAISLRMEKQLLTDKNPRFERICAAVKCGTMDIDQAAATWFEQQ